MIRRLLVLCATVGLVGPASCLDETGPAPFTTHECFRNEIRECECPDGQIGEQPCQNNGSWSDRCVCPGCTEWPDCNSCGDDCIENCMCFSFRASLQRCVDRCAQAEDAGAEDAGPDGDGAPSGEGGGPPPPPPPGTCVVAECPPPPALPLPGVMLAACCTADETCGIDFMGSCVEQNQEGTLDPSCPDVDVGELTGGQIPAGLLVLPGCCRPDGFCGALEDALLMLGCVQTTDFTGGTPQRCGTVE